MEPIYGQNLLEAGKNGIRLRNGSVLVIHHLFRTGLVYKRGKRHQGDSPDFVLLGTLDGRPIVAVIELKCRSLVKTLNAERRRLGYGEFESISCDSPLLRKYLLKRDESFAMCASCKYFVG